MSIRLPNGTVTFLFTDVEASTRRWEEHPGDMRDAMARHDATVRDAIEANGGYVFTTVGDQFCAAFSSPHQAIVAGVAAQIGLASEEWGVVGPFRVRMALHTGNADERDGDYFGPPLNRCARLLATGHGGQIVVTSSTAQLVQDDPPSGVSFKDLGAHVLKDLDRPEHVFQVLHGDLSKDFPPLRSESPAREAADLLVEGRQAHAVHKWNSAYEALTAASETVGLDAEDLARLGDAAYWTGRSDESISLREQAFGVYVREGKSEAAALLAVSLAESHKYRLAKAVSNAWIVRAERLVGDTSGTEAHGYLLRWKCVAAFESEGEPEAALDLADQVIAVGSELGDRSLEALGLMDKGRFLVAMGQIDEGMILIDEAMVAAVAGELSPDATGRSYCNMLSVCDQVADYQRAAEWSDAAQAWCQQHSDSAYPGVCRIFRAELKWRGGDWDAATADLERAVEELKGFTPIIGSALYQIGEVDLRAGRLTDAEDHFRSAHEHGFVPMPGIAELRLREGSPEAAQQLLRDALDQESRGPLARARFLPSLMRAELALGRIAESREALTELEHVADLTKSIAMRSAAAHGRAALAISTGEPTSAVQDLRGAIAGWSELQMPYEAAESRLLLAEAQNAVGKVSAAQLEKDSARATFQRLGAESDVRRVDELLLG
ncbi:MAG: adenylate/guanylate cyclase domain-containing protein [Actinomycetota bacterium]|nr:adenylate/guanylate cyclase domain-containing protein [Actinomycetota bacterium]